MGLFTPKYPKSDTPGASSAPAPKRSRRNTTPSAPTSSGMTSAQIRSLGSQPGVTVDIRGNTAKVTVDEWDTNARITSQLYVRQADGTWTA